MPTEPPQAAERRRSGRPPHQPTEATRSRVVELISADRPLVEIAREIGISKPTLRAHYAAELTAARPQISFPLPGLEPAAATRPAMPRAGRPEHVPTDDTREQVEVLVAAGMRPFHIAAVLRISEPTLRLHYAEELAGGRARKTAEVILAMHAAAKAGNVSAQKGWLSMRNDDAENDLPPMSKAPLGTPTDDPAPPVPAAAPSRFAGLH